MNRTILFYILGISLSILGELISITLLHNTTFDSNSLVILIILFVLLFLNFLNENIINKSYLSTISIILLGVVLLFNIFTTFYPMFLVGRINRLKFIWIIKSMISLGSIIAICSLLKSNKSV